MGTAPTYRVEVWTMNGAGFAPGALIADFPYAKNIGWADYLLDVPEAFFTLNQDDPMVSLLRPYKNKAHVKLYRNADLVWGGVLGEWDANETDAIFYAYGYLAELYRLLTDWNVLYTNAQINTIVSDAWTRAKTTLTSSRVGWVTTGTIEAPVTVTGGATAIILPTYRMFYKRILFLLREMAALGIGNTTNTCVFEITPSGTFNFWKNRGVDTSIVWEYGDRLVAGFGEHQVPIMRRNDLLGVGLNPNDASLFLESSSAGDIVTNGRLQEPLFFSWVRDSVELARALPHRLALAIRDNLDLAVRFYPNAIIPPGATGAGFRLSDRATVKIDRGITSQNALMEVQGVQVLYMAGQEHVRTMLADRTGS